MDARQPLNVLGRRPSGNARPDINPSASSTDTLRMPPPRSSCCSLSNAVASGRSRRDSPYHAMGTPRARPVSDSVALSSEPGGTLPPTVEGSTISGGSYAKPHPEAGLCSRCVVRHAFHDATMSCSSFESA